MRSPIPQPLAVVERTKVVLLHASCGRARGGFACCGRACGPKVCHVPYLFACVLTAQGVPWSLPPPHRF